jgi:hypothetical protein
VHIKVITKVQPAPAQSLEVILDIISQLIGVISALERLLQFDVSYDLLGKTPPPS